MPLKETIRVVQSGQRRIKIFVDFWNVVINARNQAKIFDLDIQWDKIAETLVSETNQGYFDETRGDLAGCYIFGSVSRSNALESKFVDRVIDQYGSKPGLFFNFAERVSKQTSISCTECGEAIKTRSESGVDVLLAVEMIKHASMREHEYLALVSSDRDFVPLLSYLRDQGQRVVHAATGNPDREIRSITWKQVSLAEQYPVLCKIQHDGYIILTSPSCESELQELFRAAPVPVDQLKVLDITRRDHVPDKDLNFILKNLNLYWKSEDGDPHRRFAHSYISDDLDDLRKRISTREVEGSIPYVLRNGIPEIYFNGDDSSFRWVRISDTGKRWPKLFPPT